MTCPVRPPIFPRASETPFAALPMAGPAEEVTLDRPSEAFDLNSAALSVAFDADSFAASDALEAVSFAASVALVVVDSNRRALLPGNLAVCLHTARDTDNDMVKVLCEESNVIEKLS